MPKTLYLLQQANLGHFALIVETLTLDTHQLDLTILFYHATIKINLHTHCTPIWCRYTSGQLPRSCFTVPNVPVCHQSPLYQCHINRYMVSMCETTKWVFV